MKKWGEILKERREALGLSPDKFGPMAGVSGETIRRWERSDEIPAKAPHVDKVLDRLEAEQPANLFAQVEALQREVARLAAELQRLTERL